MKITANLFVIFIALASLSFSSCKEKSQIDMFTDVKGNYFSINKYIIDEWQTHAGEPLGFKKTIKEDGKVDTSVTNVEQMDWPDILTPFIETDISDRKYLNQYTFSQFEDELDNTRNFMYVANKADMFVQKLLITMDMTSMKVRGIYIETFKKSIWSEQSQKLFYYPARTIQIHKYSKPFIGSKTDKLIQYDAIR